MINITEILFKLNFVHCIITYVYTDISNILYGDTQHSYAAKLCIDHNNAVYGRGRLANFINIFAYSRG